MFVSRNMSRRRLTVAAVMGLAVLGSAALGQQAATPPVAATTHTVVKSCPAGSAPVITGKVSNCEPLNKPEKFADLSTMANSFRSRSTAPFNSVAPGAYHAALLQKGPSPRPASYLAAASRGLPTASPRNAPISPPSPVPPRVRPRVLPMASTLTWARWDS
jgi:hypothetical protein